MHTDQAKYLESIEPVSVVIISKAANLIKGVAEMLIDMGNILEHRKDDIQEVITKVSEEGPMAIDGILPPEMKMFIMGSVMEVMSQAMLLRAELTGADGEDPEGDSEYEFGEPPPDGEYDDEGGDDESEEDEGGPMDMLEMFDPNSLKPASLIAFGTLLKEKVEGLQAVIAKYEAKLLAENPQK